MISSFSSICIKDIFILLINQGNCKKILFTLTNPLIIGFFFRIDVSGMIEETCDGEDRDDNKSPQKQPDRPQTRQKKHLKKE